jgi:hypothetical protein
MSDSVPLTVIAYGMLGITLCAVHFSALRWSVSLYCDGAPIWKALLAHTLRLAGIGAAFTVCARQGALPLLSSFGAFVATRTISLYQLSGRQGRL